MEELLKQILEVLQKMLAVQAENMDHLLRVQQQVVIELRRTREVEWIIHGKPERDGYDDVPTIPKEIPETPVG
jgi:hypothetical protein